MAGPENHCHGHGLRRVDRPGRRRYLLGGRAVLRRPGLAAALRRRRAHRPGRGHLEAGALTQCAASAQQPDRLTARVSRCRGIGRLERRQQTEGPVAERLLPFLFVEIERAGLERLVGRGARLPLALLQRFARRVIIGDQFEARFARFLDVRPEEHLRAAHIIEQGLQRLVEQRQPVLHAGVLAPRADRLVERIVVGDRAEHRDIPRTETADRFGIERRLGRGQQRDGGFGAAAQLGFRIEGADRLQLRTEEIEPQRFIRTRRPQIDDAAARRVLARLAHGAGARIGVARQEAVQLFGIDMGARPREETRPGDAFARGHALHDGVDRGDDERRPRFLAARGQGRERRQPRALDVRTRRYAVVGKAIPGREIAHVEIGREDRKSTRLNSSH